MKIAGKKRVVEYKNEYGLIDKWTYRGSTLIMTEFAYPKITKEEKNQEPMSEKQRLFEQITAEFEAFVLGHEGQTKKSQANARKHIGNIKKLVTDYRKESVAESK